MNLSLADFRQFMTGTFVSIEPCDAAPNGAVGLILPMGEGFEAIHIRTVLGTIALPWSVARTVINVDFPARALFNHNGRALLYSRVVLKQYGKSPNENNSIITDPVMNKVPSKRRKRFAHQSPDVSFMEGAVKIDLPVFQSLVYRLYFTLPAARNLLQDSAISVALSDEFALAASVSAKSRVFPIIHFDTAIGLLVNEGYEKNIYPSAAIFEQDCKDFAVKHVRTTRCIVHPYR